MHVLKAVFQEHVCLLRPPPPSWAQPFTGFSHMTAFVTPAPIVQGAHTQKEGEDMINVVISSVFYVTSPSAPVFAASTQ